MDLLYLIHEGTLDEAAAYEEYERGMDHAPETLAQQLGMSHQEWTAFCHGVPFAQLAEWRYQGWPTSCGICGKSLDAAVFGWFGREVAPEVFRLVHVRCLPPQPEDPGDDR